MPDDGRNPGRLPKLRRHKGTGQGAVTLNGHHVYLGPWPVGKKKPPAEVKTRYDEAIRRWLAAGRVWPPPDPSTPGKAEETPSPEVESQGITVGELVLKFFGWVQTYYRRADGTQTGEVVNYKHTLRSLVYLFGDMAAAELTPLKLKRVRDVMVEGYDHPRYGPQPPCCRKETNKRIGRIKRMYGWAVEEELVPVDVHAAMLRVKGLAQGRSDARESDDVPPVAWETVEATLPFLPTLLQAAVLLQWHTGCRPGEALALRPNDLDREGRVWVYRPKQHKLAYKNKPRTVFLGPQAQAVLLPWLEGIGPEECVFSPKRAQKVRHAEMRANRKSKVQPSQVCRKKSDAKRTPRDRYDRHSYGTAVERAAIKADVAAKKAALKEGKVIADNVRLVEHWHPNQIRHSHGTAVRKAYGLEAAQVALGHSKADVTQVYAERNEALARKVADEMG